MLFLAGVAQLGVLVASALVPFRLELAHGVELAVALHRQMYWVYGGYVVMAIVAFGLLSILNARELAGGSGLARGVCAYTRGLLGRPRGAARRVRRQEAPHRVVAEAGYGLLTVLFATFTLVQVMGGVVESLNRPCQI